MKNSNSRLLRLLCSSCFILSSFPAGAIELSLEENRAERGSVGYVDMQRLFKSSPDATRAREGLEELVRQAEERVNGRKSELLRLRAELQALKDERDEVARSTPTPTVPVKTVPPAATPKKEEPKKVEAAKPVEAPKAVETKPVTEAPPLTTPGAKSPMTPTPVTATAPEQKPTTSAPLTINLPGLTDGPMVLERPGASPLNPTRDRVAVENKVVETPKVEAKPEPKPEPVPEIKPEPKPEPVVEKKPEPQPEPVLPVPAGPTIAQRLIELDGQIVGKQADIDRVQAELDKERGAAEKSLLDAEGRKTDQVLARLYRAISEVAKREGVSVVVDKASTLYGHPAVDLTDKILKQLRAVAPAQQ